MVIACVIIGVLLLAWAVLVLFTHISGRRFDRRWNAMSDEERRQLQEECRKQTALL